VEISPGHAFDNHRSVADGFLGMTVMPWDTTESAGREQKRIGAENKKQIWSES
jgi:hypothetical protein